MVQGPDRPNPTKIHKILFVDFTEHEIEFSNFLLDSYPAIDSHRF